MSDPLSMIYTALWDMAEANEDLVAYVRLKNRIRYDTKDRDPEKRNVVDADVPELALLCNGISGNLCNTSHTSRLRCRYSWVTITGDLRVNYRMLPVEWNLFVAMHKWREVLGALLWKEKPFVKSMNMLDVQEGVIRPSERQDGPRGWASVWGIELDLYFDLTDMRSSGDGCTLG